MGPRDLEAGSPHDIEMQLYRFTFFFDADAFGAISATQLAAGYAGRWIQKVGLWSQKLGMQ